MPPTTIIPDIHADADRLHRSLCAAPPSNRLAFLGDLIDAGAAVAAPADQQVLMQVRAMVTAGRAVSVMGNHELNAILFHRTGKSGEPLRSRAPKNARQHRSFCDAFGIATREALDWTEWFLEFPLWLDLGGLRLVHAYWSNTDIETIAARRPDGRLKHEDLEEVAAKKSDFALAVNNLLTGPEVELPEGVSFYDKGGHRRHHARIAWWRSEHKTWRNAALSVPAPSELPDTEIRGLDDFEFYPNDAPPVLVGHYKMLGTPRIDSPNAACLDYPDTPCVYHWAGETHLTHQSLMVV